MNRPNQSFTEFRDKKRLAEEQIRKILNDFSQEFDVTIKNIDHGNRHTIGRAPAVYTVQISTDI